MSKFVHLHLHSEFSLLDGANRIKDIPIRAKELGMDSIAITDHGVMFGVIDFYKACKKEGVKPIIGCEAYVAPRSRLQKEPGIDNHYYHLILLAKNNTGYKNLSKMVSLSYIDGYYYKPRIDRELLEKTTENEFMKRKPAFIFISSAFVIILVCSVVQLLDQIGSPQSKLEKACAEYQMDYVRKENCLEQRYSA